MKILTFGELLLRLEAPAGNVLFQKDFLNSSFCGAEANVAVSLANLGDDVDFFTVVPNNKIGKNSLKNLNFFGVNTSKCLLSNKGRMGLLFLERGASQRSSDVIYDRQYSSLSLLNANEVSFDIIFKDVQWFHITGITPALSNSLADICIKACEYANKHNITISCDLNFRKKLWSESLAQKTMQRIMPFVDVCIGNEEDAAKMLLIDFDNNNALEKYTKISEEIVKRFGTKTIAFSLRTSINASINKWSGFLYQSGIPYVAKDYEIIIVDRVGSGDSFAAGIIHSLSNCYDPQKAIDFATALGCLKHTIEGDFSRFTSEDIENLLLSAGNGRITR